MSKFLKENPPTHTPPPKKKKNPERKMQTLY